MSLHNIPINQNNPSSSTRELDVVISEYRQKMLAACDKQIQQLTAETNQKITALETDAVTTYKLLMEPFKEKIQLPFRYRIEIKGYNVSDDVPTMNSWILHNVGKMAAIRFFSHQLEDKHWKPTMSLSKYIYYYDEFTDSIASYSGGDTVIIECEMT